MNITVRTAVGRPSSASARIRALLLRTPRNAIALLLSAAGAVGAYLYVNSLGITAAPPRLDGTWELVSVEGFTLGDSNPAGVVSQRAAFRGGTLRGETLLKPPGDPASFRLPFPDESVERVVSSADGTGLRILWSGTYDINDGRQLTLRIGKTVYFAKLSWGADNQSIGFDQDLILALHGAVSYRRMTSNRTPSRPPSSLLHSSADTE